MDMRMSTRITNLASGVYMASAALGLDFQFVFFIQVFMKFCWFSLSLSRSVNKRIYTLS